MEPVFAPQAGAMAPMLINEPLDMVPMENFPGQPKKKHTKKIVFSVIGLALVGVILYNVIGNAVRGPAPLLVDMQAAETGTVLQTINTTGTIVTGEKVTVFSPVTAPVVEVNGEVGRYIQEGTPIVTFGTVELDRAYRQASAAKGLSSLQAQAALSNSKESQETVDSTQASINNLKDQRDKARAIIAQLQGQRAAIMAEFPTYVDDKARLAVLQSIAAPTPEEQAEMQLLILSTGAVDAKLAAVDGQIAVQQGDIANSQALLGQLDGMNTAADKTVLDENGRQQLNAQGVNGQVAFETAQANLAAAQKGLQAPISGILTSLTANEGGAASQYSPLFVIESLDKVDVSVSLSRFDVERVKEGQKVVVTTLGNNYDAVVSKVNSMATPVVGSSGSSAMVTATISLVKPDKDIRLGLEASVEISTGRVDNAVKVPVSAINTDIDGTYCFVVKDNIAYRRDVTIGISSDTQVEVLTGIEAGDMVILSSQNVNDGDKVAQTPAIASGASTAGGGMVPPPPQN